LCPCGVWHRSQHSSVSFDKHEGCDVPTRQHTVARQLIAPQHRSRRHLPTAHYKRQPSSHGGGGYSIRTTPHHIPTPTPTQTQTQIRTHTPHTTHTPHAHAHHTHAHTTPHTPHTHKHARTHPVGVGRRAWCLHPLATQVIGSDWTRRPNCPSRRRTVLSAAAPVEMESNGT
jgi:hypothetical protein